LQYQLVLHVSYLTVVIGRGHHAQHAIRAISQNQEGNGQITNRLERWADPMFAPKHTRAIVLTIFCSSVGQIGAGIRAACAARTVGRRKLHGQRARRRGERPEWRACACEAVDHCGLCQPTVGYEHNTRPTSCAVCLASTHGKHRWHLDGGVGEAAGPLDSIDIYLSRRQLRWAGHVSRMDYA
jgi:hypothetical protein